LPLRATIAAATIAATVVLALCLPAMRGTLAWLEGPGAAHAVEESSAYAVLRFDPPFSRRLAGDTFDVQVWIDSGANGDTHSHGGG
jgi:hypothetical protein